MHSKTLSNWTPFIVLFVALVGGWAILLALVFYTPLGDQLGKSMGSGFAILGIFGMAASALLLVIVFIITVVITLIDLRKSGSSGTIENRKI